MEFTIWEKSVLGSAIGCIDSATNVAEIERLLDLRKKFALTEEEDNIIENREEEKARQTVNIDVTEQDLQLFDNLINTREIPFPVDQQTVSLNHKIKSKLEDHDGSREEAEN